MTASETHVERLRSANNGRWPVTLRGYIRLVWHLGQIPCVPDPLETKAVLVPTRRGEWQIRYNPALPDRTIIAYLLHEASEWISRTDKPSLFGTAYAGQATASAGGNDPERYRMFHRRANAVVRHWCYAHGHRYTEVMTGQPPTMPSDASADDRYSRIVQEIERIPCGANVECAVIGRKARL